MRDKELASLAQTVSALRSAILNSLGENAKFHDVFNGAGALPFFGLGLDRAEYFIDPVEALVWIDPEGYVDELERWRSDYLTVTHKAIINDLKASDQVPVFLDLVGAIQRKRVAPFVGAGLSYPYGYPLWGQAVELLISKLEGVSASGRTTAIPAYLTEARLFVATGNYVDAAQLLYDNEKTQVENFILNKFSLLAADNIENPHGAVNVLPNISSGCIITTNYDGIIEQIYKSRNRPIEGYMHGTQTKNKFVASLIKGDLCILKLHGDALDPDTYIFSKQQYEEAYGVGAIDYSKPLAKALRQIFVSHSVLFLGCSLEQDRTLTLLEQVVNEGNFEVPNHFAIVPRPEVYEEFQEKERRLLELKIRPIWYDALLHNHSAVEALLALADDCAHGRIKI